MRTGLPVSRGHLRLRFSLFDTVWALAAPILALVLREARILSLDGLLYCLISLAFSLIAYSAFRLHDGVSRFFNVDDAWNVVKAVACAELTTCVLLFTLTRLENIPRSTLVLHGLVLGAGLIAVRAFARWRETDSGAAVRPEGHGGVEHVIMIGCTTLTFVFMKFLAAYCPGRRRVIALLDSGAEMSGRSISGVRVLGSPDHLQPVIDEFAEHGVRTDRVVIGGGEDLLPEEALREVRRVCEQRQIPLDFVPELVGLSALDSGGMPEQMPTITRSTPQMVPAYFKWKYVGDFALAAIMLMLYAPFLVVAVGLALLDVGWPFWFWQQRLGAGGRPFTIYKIRTLRPPFDQRGREISQQKRLSWVGALLRKTRLDELPQLVNVLAGEMSLVGPRPLLPRDQPSNPSARLLVRPGITGWAQVNGATLLTPAEKDALDEWYVRNASFWLDLRIILMTFGFLVWGPRCGTRVEANASGLTFREPAYASARAAMAPRPGLKRRVG